MNPIEKTLLLIDAVANCVLGAVLLCFPLGIDRLLGLPASESRFYPTILGGVIFGIGIALLLARAGRAGLGIDGAIAINLVGAGVLVLWLVICPPQIPRVGMITLWAVAVIVLGIGVIELVHRFRSPTESSGGRHVENR